MAERITPPLKEKPQSYMNYIFLAIKFVVCIISFFWLIFDFFKSRKNTVNWLIIFILMLLHVAIEIFLFASIIHQRKIKLKIALLGKILEWFYKKTHKLINNDIKKTVITGVNFCIWPTFFFLWIFQLKFSSNGNQLTEEIIFDSVMFYIQIRSLLDVLGITILLMLKYYLKNEINEGKKKTEKILPELSSEFDINERKEGEDKDSSPKGESGDNTEDASKYADQNQNTIYEYADEKRIIS